MSDASKSPYDLNDVARLRAAPKCKRLIERLQRENERLREELRETRRAPYRKHGYVEKLEAIDE